MLVVADAVHCISNVLQRSGTAPTIYLFVVDTCQDEDNLQALKV